MVQDDKSRHHRPKPVNIKIPLSHET